MSRKKPEPLWTLMGLLFRSHPWHGVSIGPAAPDTVTVYIELTPHDTVKYELDKVTGIIKVDRPQRFSSVCPALYGFIPQTYCAEKVAELTQIRTGRKGIAGDGDPLDILVLAERSISHGNCLLQARPIGGLRMLDGEEADDKIIAVMKDDLSYGRWTDISDCPDSLMARLRHYFLTYKQVPGSPEQTCEITHVYDREEAHDLIRRSQQDYHTQFGDISTLLTAALRQ
jgi:inorganic pyrophosphatase